MREVTYTQTRKGKLYSLDELKDVGETPAFLFASAKFHVEIPFLTSEYYSVIEEAGRAGFSPDAPPERRVYRGWGLLWLRDIDWSLCLRDLLVKEYSLDHPIVKKAEEPTLSGQIYPFLKVIIRWYSLRNAIHQKKLHTAMTAALNKLVSLSNEQGLEFFEDGTFFDEKEFKIVEGD